MRYFIIITILLLLPSLAEATLRPTDFAYGMPLSFQKGGAVCRFSVPREVYETVTRDDLGDIRVFNNADIAVPHILRRPQEKREVTERMTALPFFPLYGEKDRMDKDGLSVRIEKGGDGAIINVETDDTGSEKDRKLSGYIIDASKHRARISELHVNWQAEEENSVTTVSVEYSNDLTHWSSLVSMATLVQMHFSGHEITRKRIPLIARRGKYLRLSWPSGREGIEVKEIFAVRRVGAPERKSVWTALKGKPGSKETKRGKIAYEYDSAARLPLERIRLRFAEKNTLVKVTLLSRPEKEAEWRFRKSGVFYNLTFDQTSLVQDTVAVEKTTDRFWRLEIEEGSSGDPKSIPVVELGWQPHELLFVVQGEAPFMLAYGSARLGEEELRNSTTRLLPQILGEKSSMVLHDAVLLKRVVLGGPDLLVPTPPPVPWKVWLLWGVLVAGVLIIARMALSLARGMNKEKQV
jgi:hypothetical protein